MISTLDKASPVHKSKLAPSALRAQGVVTALLAAKHRFLTRSLTQCEAEPLRCEATHEAPRGRCQIARQLA